MKLLISCLLLTLSFCSINVMTAQEEAMTAGQALRQESIEKQFDMVIRKSGRYQEYKVVKRTWMDKLKANTIDTLKTLEDKLSTAREEIAKQETTINDLQTSLGDTNKDLEAVSEEKDNMNFMGVAMTKSSYKTMMWSIVGVLLALLAFFIFQFKNSNAVTVRAKKALAETEVEFEDHRRRSLEREQKVMRKLQDEINKQRKAGTK
ncbi:tRNA (guanine-N1)-methyltransferase [Aquimarina sp. ERC-38]|uniref:tRNA (guanine-N1)-methyltransferase n=1 Tax=Aquimarina sp. ERC-38 TaxID=2949996 RepID=UPI002245803E|nr:tRNA (guanine-N1)-methyltransferase [Aquimarina sp. ERC-38]UZO79344.1 tRNA (guanine-N1)-methyltransferase [Aquimarina sp. ERC-38]